MSTNIATIPKNSREAIRLCLAEFKGHKFIDMRIYAKEDGKDPVPTPKGLTVSPHLMAAIQEGPGPGGDWRRRLVPG